MKSVGYIILGIILIICGLLITPLIFFVSVNHLFGTELTPTFYNILAFYGLWMVFVPARIQSNRK